MTKSLGKLSAKRGQAPGTLMHVGTKYDMDNQITVVNYNATDLQKQVVYSIDDILPYKEKKDTITWVHCEGLDNESFIEAIGQHFDIHPLVLEDILNTEQRSKFEEYEQYLFIVLKGLFMENNVFSDDYEQISILLLENFVFTFKERADDMFDPLLCRLENGQARFRLRGTDYLTYVILDTIVDQYFYIQDYMDDMAESIEDQLLTKPTSNTLSTIQKVKREMVFIRRSIAPFREVLSSMEHSDSSLIDEKTHPYLRDVYDHAILISEAMDSQRDLIAGMLDIYLSSVSNKMNETMKVLTVFASIFIPLTFVAGVYGMNFENMPELRWKWSYPAVLTSFFIIPTVLVIYFKKKKWL